jgi:hypothetical protein
VKGVPAEGEGRVKFGVSKWSELDRFGGARTGAYLEQGWRFLLLS